jgi:restriction system protein
MNEGATKGILVTTADYGPDAYDFAKNKLLTLMNGANLLTKMAFLLFYLLPSLC